MAQANRYEVGDDEECARILVQDMQDRFRLLSPEQEDQQMMESVFDLEPDTDAAQRRCSGLVLKAMGFIENGL